MKRSIVVLLVALLAQDALSQGYGPPPTKGKKHRTTTTTTEQPGFSNEISGPFPVDPVPPPRAHVPSPGPERGAATGPFWWQGQGSPFKPGSTPAGCSSPDGCGPRPPPPPPPHGGCGGPAGCVGVGTDPRPPPPPPPHGGCGGPAGCVGVGTDPRPPPPPPPAPGCGGPTGCTGVGTDPRPSPPQPPGQPIDIHNNPFLNSAIYGKPIGQGPTQYPGQGPTQQPGQGPTQYPGQGPTQYPGQGPSQQPGQGPTQYPGQGPTQYPGQGPTPQHPGQGPPKYPGQGPTQYPGQGPTQYPGQGPTQYPGQGPTQHPGQGPTQYPGQGPTQYPGQGPTQHPGQGPSQYPGQGPTHQPPSVFLRPVCPASGHACVLASECANGVATSHGMKLMRDIQVKECIPGSEVCCRVPPGHGAPFTPGYAPSAGPVTTNRPYTGPLNTTPYPGCPAALKCVQEIYCTWDGVMSDTPVALTREQADSRVPITDCQDLETGIIGKCCRDPNYKDPWPGGMMMKNPGDFDDGQYHPESQPGSNPGGHPGTQPGTYPGGHPGTHPGTYPGGHPGTHPGTYPGGHPGSHPGNHPGSHPTGYPGSHPGGNINVISSTPQSPAKDHGPKPSDGPGGFNKPFPPPFPGNTPTGSTYPSGKPSQPNPDGPFYQPDQSTGTSYPGQPKPTGSYQPGQPAGTPYQPGQPSPTSTSHQPGQPGFPNTYQPGQPTPTGQSHQPGFPGTYQPGQPTPTGPSSQPGYPGNYQPGQPTPTGPSAQPGYPGNYQPGQPTPTGPSHQPAQPSFPDTYQPGQPTPTGTYQPGQPGSPDQGPNFNLPTHPGHNQPSDSGPAPGTECGVRRPGPGGDVAGFAEFPWQALVVAAGNRSLLCGAAIIADNAVITAAHCVNQNRGNDLLVKAGEWKLLGQNPKAVQVRPVEVIARHPGYNAGSLAKDLAILVLSTPLTLDTHVDKICLPAELGSEYFQKPGQTCVLTGWGKNALQGPIQDSPLHKIDVSVIPAKQCEEQLKTSQNLGKYFILNEGFSCALPPSPSDLCKVDFGSAVACDRGDGHYELAGVNSWDLACQTRQPLPSVFATSDAEWMNNVLSSPLPELQQQEQDYLQGLLQGEGPGDDTDDKPGFSQGYGK